MNFAKKNDVLKVKTFLEEIIEYFKLSIQFYYYMESIFANQNLLVINVR